MSWLASNPPEYGNSTCSPIGAVITPRPRDIGDFDVRRALPAQECRSVGPFVFFDQMGPVVFGKGQAMDVRPHPHIGLSTLTWLFEGEVRHRDSLGYDQVIRPGEVNWMTAGRGIVHSERSPDAARGGGASLFGIQTWMALPIDKEEMEPAFYHYGADEIPRMHEGGVDIALVAGTAFGMTSPVHTESPTFYAELKLQAGAACPVPREIPERAVYVCRGEVEINGDVFEEGSMLVFKPNTEATLRAKTDCLCMLLGGEPLLHPRRLWWNFVSSRPERIEQAKHDWVQGRFGTIEGDDEFIPLPEK